MSNQTSQTPRKLCINLSLLWASCALGILNWNCWQKPYYNCISTDIMCVDLCWAK